MGSDRFVKFSEAGVKSFSDQIQENANTKNKTSLPRYNLKLFKEFLANEEEMRSLCSLLERKMVSKTLLSI